MSIEYVLLYCETPCKVWWVLSMYYYVGKVKLLRSETLLEENKFFFANLKYGVGVYILNFHTF